MAKQSKAKAQKRAKVDLTTKSAVSHRGGMAVIGNPQPQSMAYKFYDVHVSAIRRGA
jgi:hypothetical protein